MQRYIFKRLLQSLATLVVLSLVIFVLARMTGDPVRLLLPPEASEQDVAKLRANLGLDRSQPVQFAAFLRDALKGDFGNSVKNRRPVVELIRDRLPNSLRLAAASIALTLLIAIPLGVIGTIMKGTIVDGMTKWAAVLGQAVPPFWLGIVLVDIFTAHLRWLPASGSGGIDHYIMPAITLGLFGVAGVTRLMRSSLLDVLDSEFVKFARIKGLSDSRVIWKHAVRNALIPVVTFASIYFASLITMAVVVEVVFAWNGVGRLAYDAIMTRDFPVIQGVVLTGGAIALIINLLVDILYAYLDPRIRYERAK